MSAADASAPLASKSKSKKAQDHPKYSQMISEAIQALKDRNGSSRQAISKFIKATYKVDESSSETHIKQALRRGVKSGTLIQTKGTGASGSFKIPKLPKSGAAAEKKKPVKKPAKKPTAPKPKKKKEATPKKKKTAPKKSKKVKAKKPADKKKKTTKKASSKTKTTKSPKKSPAKKAPAKKSGKKTTTKNKSSGSKKKK